MAAKMTSEQKIAALLKKAETTTPEEAEILTAKAVELMQKYGVTQALLDAAKIGTDKKERIEQLHIPLEGIYAKAYMRMMDSIAKAYGDVETFYTQWKSNVTLTITGFESDVSQLKILLASLQLQVVTALSVWVKGGGLTDAYAETAMEKFKARRQFIKSFGDGAASRIWQARRRVVQEAETSTPGATLVLRERGALVKDFVKSKHPNLKTEKAREQHGGYAASNAGYTAGRNANTGDRQVGNKQALKA